MDGWITPNIALRSGSLNRKGMLDTWRRLGISLGEADPPLPPATPLDPTTPLPALAIPTSVTSAPADPATLAPFPAAPDTLDPAPPLDVLVAAATACAAATLGSPTSEPSDPPNCGSDNPNAAFNSACNFRFIIISCVIQQTTLIPEWNIPSSTIFNFIPFRNSVRSIDSRKKKN